MPPKIYRQELKRLLSPGRSLLLMNRIAAILPSDEHAGNDGSYSIRSIYFDTFDDRAFTEKEAGISEREKIRIRFYDYKDDVIKLERKEKREKLIYKDSIDISKDTADAMLSGDFTPLLSYDSELADYIYGLSASSMLAPTVVVDYVRRAFIYPAGNVRITFDESLQSGRPDTHLWQPGSVFDVLNDYTILEIKFNKYIPEHICRLLESVPGETMALSKYTLCRQNLLLKQGDYLGGKI